MPREPARNSVGTLETPYGTVARGLLGILFENSPGIRGRFPWPRSLHPPILSSPPPARLLAREMVQAGDSFVTSRDSVVRPRTDGSATTSPLLERNNPPFVLPESSSCAPPALPRRVTQSIYNIQIVRDSTVSKVESPQRFVSPFNFADDVLARDRRFFHWSSTRECRVVIGIAYRAITDHWQSSKLKFASSVLPFARQSRRSVTPNRPPGNALSCFKYFIKRTSLNATLRKLQKSHELNQFCAARRRKRKKSRKNSGDASQD